MSVNIQSRIDICSLATIARAYVERGAELSTRSELVARIVEDMAMIATSSGVDRFSDVEEAEYYLERQGLVVASSPRAKKELWKDKVRNTGLHDFGSADMFSTKRATKGAPMSMSATELRAEAEKIAARLRAEATENNDVELQTKAVQRDAKQMADVRAAILAMSGKERTDD